MSLVITRKGYYRVVISGLQWSQHVDPNEAIEVASQLLDTNPELLVEVLPPRVEIRSTTEASEVVASSQPPPESDGGMDLVDFLSMLDDEANGPRVYGTVIAAPNFWAGIRQLVVTHRDGGSWLAQRLQVDGDGDPDTKDAVRVGLSWRGYVLLWHLRDKTAIRIGGQA